MLNPLKTTAPENSGFLVLDVGTEVVKALVCEAGENSVTVIGVGREPQQLGDMQSGSVLDIGGVIEHCSRAIREAQTMARREPKDLVMGIAGELVKGINKRTTYIRKDPESKIDLPELRDIIHKVQRRSFEEARKELAFETGFQEIDVKLVHAAIVDVRIDGYKVTNPIGFQGREIEIAIFNSFAPLVHFGALQTIAAELELNLLTIVSEPFALAQAVAKQDDVEVNAIILDIGAGTTNIALIRGGCLEGTKMFSIGGRTFSKRLAHSLNTSYREAEEIKISYAHQKLEKNSERIVRDCLSTDCELWISGVAFSLAEFHGVDVLPPKILICGGSCHLPEIQHALGESAWREDLPFAKPPSLSILNPKHIMNVRDTTKKLIDAQDVTPCAIALIGKEHIGDDQLLNRLMKHVVRLMHI